MQLYKGNLKWYDNYIDDFHHEVVYGFAKTIIDFVNKINEVTPNIEKIEIEIVNWIATDSELIYVDANDLATQAAIEKENDY